MTIRLKTNSTIARVQMLQIQNIFKKYEHKHPGNLSHPHKLQLSFEVAILDYEQSKQQDMFQDITNLAKRIEPFWVVVNKAGIKNKFHSRSIELLPDDESEQQLVTLYNSAIVGDLARYTISSRFLVQPQLIPPHIYLAGTQNKKLAKALVQEINEIPIEIFWKIDSLVMESTRFGEGNSKHTFPLGGSG